MKNKIKLLSLAIIFINLIQANAQAPKALEGYLQHAFENSPRLKASYKKFEAALEKIPQLKAMPDPKLSFGFFILPVETRVGPQQARFSLSQQFPWFGVLTGRGDAAALKAEAFFQEFLNEKNRLAMEVKTAYFPIYELKRDIKWQEENLEILETYKLLAAKAFSNGKGALTDALRVDIMIENTQTQIRLLKDKTRPLESTFNRLLHRDDSLKVEVPEGLSALPIENGYRKDSLEIQNPVLQAFDRRLRSLEIQEQLAEKEAMPKLGVGLDYVLVGKRTDASPMGNGKNVLMPMVSVSLPIAKAKYKAAVKEQQLKQLQLESQKMAMTDKLWANYENTRYALEKSLVLCALYDKQIEKTEQVIKLMQAAYSNSGKDFGEILRMQQEVLKYHIAKAGAVKDYYVALARLDYLTAKSN